MNILSYVYPLSIFLDMIFSNQTLVLIAATATAVVKENAGVKAFTLTPALHILTYRRLFFQILATPVRLAASAVALATASLTLGSNALGMTYSGVSSSSETSPAIA